MNTRLITLSDEEISLRIAHVKRWHHSIKLGNICTPGKIPYDHSMSKAETIPENLEGKSVLDVGAWDGFFSFLCENRGASRALAIDNWQYEEDLKNKGFIIAKEILNSKVEYMKLDVNDIDQIDESFDIVLFFGVYYHLENPLLALKKLFSRVKEEVILTGSILVDERPIMYFLETGELGGDPNNYWLATPSCIERMCKRVGYTKVVLQEDVSFRSKKKIKGETNGNFYEFEVSDAAFHIYK